MSSNGQGARVRGQGSGARGKEQGTRRRPTRPRFPALYSFNPEVDFEKCLTIHAHQLRICAFFGSHHCHIQTFVPCARNCSRKAVSFLAFESELGAAGPEISRLELKAAKAIAADVIEAAFRLATVDEIRRPATRTLESERQRSYHSRGAYFLIGSRIKSAFWKFEKDASPQEAQRTRRLRRALESDLCATSAFFATLR